MKRELDKEIREVIEELDDRWIIEEFRSRYFQMHGSIPTSCEERAKREWLRQRYRTVVRGTEKEKPLAISVRTGFGNYIYVDPDEAKEEEVLNWIQHRYDNSERDIEKLKEDIEWFNERFRSTGSEISFHQISRGEFRELI